VINIVWTTRFVRAYKKITKNNPDIKIMLYEVIKRMKDDIFHPKLYTHKLKGHLTGSWACSAGYDLRIVFEMRENTETNEQEIILLSLGTHDEVY